MLTFCRCPVFDRPYQSTDYHNGCCPFETPGVANEMGFCVRHIKNSFLPPYGEKLTAL
jgi:hypothetical protein